MPDVSIEGLQALQVKLNSVASMQKLTQAVKQACALVEADAKQNAPKDTGALKRSITTDVEVQGNNDIVGKVFTPLEYAPYIEYGTGLFSSKGNGRTDVPWRYQADDGEFYTTYGITPNPFLEPALINNRQNVIDIIKKGAI